MPEKRRIALLIDCDNVSHNAIDGVLEELATHGTVNVRHAHGDWNSPRLSGWAEKLHPHAIRPMQQFAYTKGKNVLYLTSETVMSVVKRRFASSNVSLPSD